jgi:hypothetical protein
MRLIIFQKKQSPRKPAGAPFLGAIRGQRPINGHKEAVPTGSFMQ